MEKKKKAIAGILAATIVLAGIAIAVSAEGEGGVRPMAIVPGAIVTEHLATGAVTTDKILNSTILVGDIADNAVTTYKILNETILTDDILNGTILEGDFAAGALPNIVNNTALSFSITDAYSEIFNHTITTDRPAKFIITYTGEASVLSASNLTLVKVEITNRTTYPFDRVLARPGAVNFTDSTSYRLTHSTQFLNETAIVPAGTRYVTVSARVVKDGDLSAAGGSGTLKNNMLTVEALPA
jgi:hypothetical protein